MSHKLGKKPLQSELHTQKFPAFLKIERVRTGAWTTSMDLEEDEEELERMCWIVCCPPLICLHFTRPWYAIGWWYRAMETITAQQRQQPVQRDK